MTMLALKKQFVEWWRWVTVESKPRPLTGFFAGLTAEQKKAALEYRGDENHGDPTFPKAA